MGGDGREFQFFHCCFNQLLNSCNLYAKFEVICILHFIFIPGFFNFPTVGNVIYFRF